MVRAVHKYGERRRLPEMDASSYDWSLRPAWAQIALQYTETVPLKGLFTSRKVGEKLL
jgi:hypothetical protein